MTYRLFIFCVLSLGVISCQPSNGTTIENNNTSLDVNTACQFKWHSTYKMPFSNTQQLALGVYQLTVAKASATEATDTIVSIRGNCPTNTSAPSSGKSEKKTTRQVDLMKKSIEPTSTGETLTMIPPEFTVRTKSGTTSTVLIKNITEDPKNFYITIQDKSSSPINNNTSYKLTTALTPDEIGEIVGISVVAFFAGPLIFGDWLTVVGSTVKLAEFFTQLAAGVSIAAIVGGMVMGGA